MQQNNLFSCEIFYRVSKILSRAMQMLEAAVEALLVPFSSNKKRKAGLER